jgi:signal transduction histidine kinase
MGLPAIALYMNDVTVKIRNKFHRLQLKEKQQIEITTESFTSTVSHEMRTPISTIMFFIQMILTMTSSG